MNTRPPRPSLKSLTTPRTGPAAAEQAAPPATEGARRVAAEGVLSALRPDPHPGHRITCPLCNTDRSRAA